MKRIAALVIAATLGTSLTSFAQDYVPTPVTISKEKVKLNGKVYLSHVVLEKQTVYSITRAYGVTEEELYEANPALKETGLQKNAILLIPYKELLLAPDGSVQDYTEHTVRWYEDIDDIAKRYNLTVKEIMDANGLKSRKLSTRQVLKIPVPKPAAQEEKHEENPATVDQGNEEPVAGQESAVEQEPVVETPDTTVFFQIKAKDSVEFSLVLPMSAEDLNMDFYSGVLLAVKDLEASGLKVKANVYDLSTGFPPMDVLKGSDFVLGPISSRDLEAILQRVDGAVPVISPLDQKAASLSQYYRNFIQVPPASENQFEDLAGWLKEEAGESDKIILITEKGASNINAAVSMRSAMARRELPYEILNYAIVEGRGIPGTLTEMMTKTGVNRVVVASESEAFVGDAVRNLSIMLGKGYDVVMYAPSKVRTFDTIEGSAYHDASLHISAAYHADYSAPAVDRFVRAYRALFRTEPSQFAFQGYDTALYFARCATSFGHWWTAKLTEEEGSGLHTNFHFETDSHGNFVNRAVRRIVFKKDYSTVLVR